MGDRFDWNLWFPRPLEISQWTFASSRGHPILIDVLRRVVQDAFSNSTNPIDGSSSLSVVERTGPGPFTDSVFRYLKMKHAVEWSEFRSLGRDGWRGEEGRGDVKVLSITGFSPGVETMGALELDDKAAMVKHGFAGSWKEQEGANGRV